MEDVLCLKVLFRNQEILKGCQLKLANEFQKCRTRDLLGIVIRWVDKPLTVVWSSVNFKWMYIKSCGPLSCCQYSDTQLRCSCCKTCCIWLCQSILFVLVFRETSTHINTVSLYILWYVRDTHDVSYTTWLPWLSLVLCSLWRTCEAEETVEYQACNNIAEPDRSTTIDKKMCRLPWELTANWKVHTNFLCLCDKLLSHKGSHWIVDINFSGPFLDMANFVLW